MINAKAELIDTLIEIGQTFRDVAACRLSYESLSDNRNMSVKGIAIPFSSLDFEYDNGFGSQHLYGTILFKDNTWLSREEYDGSEYWQYNVPPTIEDILS